MLASTTRHLTSLPPLVTKTSADLILPPTCSQEEIDKRLAKRMKKEKKRTGEEVEGEATLQEMVRRVKENKVGGKMRSADVLVTGGGSDVRCLVVLANNLVEVIQASDWLTQ